VQQLVEPLCDPMREHFGHKEGFISVEDGGKQVYSVHPLASNSGGVPPARSGEFLLIACVGTWDYCRKS